ncbi:MAG: MerR family transcriptional regulator [Rhizobiaceae bacterium]
MNNFVETNLNIELDESKNLSDRTIYKIGDLAREFDVTLRTLRFYEDRGLIKPARQGTTRLYSSEDRERLRVALFCKRIGLTLSDIRKVLELHEINDDVPLAETKIRDVYASQLKTLEQQQIDTRATIADLQRKIENMADTEVVGSKLPN